MSAPWTGVTEREYITDLAVIALGPFEVDGGASQELYRVTLNLVNVQLQRLGQRTVEGDVAFSHDVQSQQLRV